MSGLPHTFATYPAGNFPAADWDSNWNFLGALSNIYCTTGGTGNAITLTPASTSVSVSAYQNGSKYTFIAAANNSGTTTIAVGALAALQVYQTNGVLIGSGAVTINTYYEAVYDSTLNGNVGGFRLTSVITGTANPTAKVGLTVVAGTETTVMRSDAAPPIDQSISPTWTGTHTFSNTSPMVLNGVQIGTGSPNVVSFTGTGNSLTTSLHVNPGSGTLQTGTISEVSIMTTFAQAFGGNYGRWSFTNQGSGLNYESGIFGEFGGTTATGAMGNFVLQNGIENPPSTFLTVAGWSFQTTAGASEDNNQGAILFGTSSDNSIINKIVLIQTNVGAAGTRDSHGLLWEAKANDGVTERAVWWRQKVNPTSNAGASSFLFQSNLNGAGWTTRASLSDGGVFNVTTGFQIGGAAASGNFLRGNGTNFVSNTIQTSDIQTLAPTWTGVQTYNISQTIASATGAHWRNIYMQPATTTITGNTGSPITRMDAFSLGQQTLTDASAVTVTDAATLYIDNSPAAAGSVTITNSWSLLVGAGNAKFGGHVNVEGVLSTGATGTGKFVFDASPTISGHPTVEGVTSTGATGTGKFVFDTAPTFTTSITSPIVYGGSSAGSTLTLQSTSSGSPSGDLVAIEAGGTVVAQIFGANSGQMGVGHGAFTPWSGSTLEIRTAANQRFSVGGANLLGAGNCFQTFNDAISLNEPLEFRSSLTAFSQSAVQIGWVTANLGVTSSAEIALGMQKQTASSTAPGAGYAKLQVVAGTNAGTAKLIMFAGTSSTPTTVVDNVGAGF